MARAIIPPAHALAMLTAGVAGLLLLPDLVSQSMDFDGVLYAGLAKLAAAEGGHFWSLSGLEPGSRFIDHPPLGIYLQSLWLQMLGDHWYSDKLWVALNITLLAGLISRLSPATATWPVWLVLVAMPVTRETLAQNYLEVPMSVACLGALLCGLRAYRNMLWCVPCALLICSAVLIKGPVGLLPLTLPLALWYLHGKFWRAFILGNILLLLVVAILGGMYWASAEARTFVDAYWQQQVWASIQGLRSVQHGRLDLLLELVTALACGGLVAWLLARVSQPERANRQPRQALFWLILGLCASLPLLLSSRTYAHYLWPSVLFFALSLCCWLPASATGLVNRLPVRLRQTGTLASLGGVGLALMLATLPQLGREGRHVHHIHHADVLAPMIGARTVGVCAGFEQLRLRGYLLRRHGIQSGLIGGLVQSGLAPAKVMCHRSPGIDDPLGYTQVESALQEQKIYLWQRPGSAAAEDI